MRFLTSAACLEQCPPITNSAFAFVGRSNVGKSSVINALCHQKSLAKTSKTPGRTQLINFFQADNDLQLIDLPGYGYAKVSRDQQRVWQKEITRFLTQCNGLCGLVLIVDIRHLLKPSDSALLALAENTALPVHIILNKADKLSRQRANQTLFNLQKTLQKSVQQVVGLPTITAQTFSATQRQGLETFYEHLATNWLPAEDSSFCSNKAEENFALPE